jgi:hypothetical protein
VLRVVGETETTQENINDWLELDEGEPEFQILTQQGIAEVIFRLFSSALLTLLHFLFIFFPSLFCLLGLSFAVLIRISFPKLIRISEVLL